MLLELSKKDKKWRHIALKLCGNKELADDIVQDMYLKLHDKEDLKDFYVVLTLKSIFYDYCKKPQNVTIEDYHLHNIQLSKDFEPTDYESVLLARYDKLSFLEKEFIREMYDNSFRSIAKKVKACDYAFVFRKSKKAIKKVLKGDYKNYNNSNLKYNNSNLKKDGKEKENHQS